MQELLEEYRMLEVSEEVSFPHLKQAYKDLVMVWHPDRFSGHPRLQKKAEEKLKSINLAYQKLSEYYRDTSQQAEISKRSRSAEKDSSSCSSHQTPHHRDSRAQHTSRAYRSAKSNTQARTQKTRTATRSTSSGFQTAWGEQITFPQAQFLLHHFQFRQQRSPSKTKKSYKGGPFQLEFSDSEQYLLIVNLCDSINGFHPILLTIPCKASGLFYGGEAQELIQFLQS